MGTGEMGKKHEHMCAAREECSNEAAFIQALRGRLRQYFSSIITAKENTKRAEKE